MFLELKAASILYTDDAPSACYDNTTGIQIFVILAKRIQTTSNQTITNQELINFGDKLAEQYQLTDLECKNYLLLIGVEAAKTAYTRTGRHLKLPDDLMVRIYNQSENVFKEKNYMEGLNKMIDEIGEQMIDPFKNEITQIIIDEQNTTTVEEDIEAMNITTEVYLISTTESTEKIQMIVTPWWMFVLMIAAIILSIVALTLLGINKISSSKRLQMQTIVPLTRTDTAKSSNPSTSNHEDMGDKRFATITILRELGMDDESPNMTQRKENLDKGSFNESTAEENEGNNLQMVGEKEELTYDTPMGSNEFTTSIDMGNIIIENEDLNKEKQHGESDLNASSNEFNVETQTRYNDKIVSAF